MSNCEFSKPVYFLFLTIENKFFIQYIMIMVFTPPDPSKLCYHLTPSFIFLFSKKQVTVDEEEGEVEEERRKTR